MTTKRVYRSSADRIVGGVCGGLAAYVHVDALIVRILFVALAMINGFGVIAYFLLWLLLPVEEQEYQNQEEMIKRNTEEMKQRARELGQEVREAFGSSRVSPGDAGRRPRNRALIVGFALLALGVFVLFDNLGLLVWFRFDKLWPLLLIAVGAVLLLNNLRERRP